MTTFTRETSKRRVLPMIFTSRITRFGGGTMCRGSITDHLAEKAFTD